MTADSSITTAAGQNGSSNGQTNGTPRTKICVYCGSSGGMDPDHMEVARELARVMAENDIDLGKAELTDPFSQSSSLRKYSC
jgi:hypothetical protein